MVQILPFAGWRYDLSQVGALSEVIAPPAELVDEALQHQLYRQHPCNVVRLVMNREEPGDTSPADRCVRADDFWRLWKREGILLREHDLAFYIVETTFQSGGHERVRWSLIARLRLPDASDESPDNICSVVEEEGRDAVLETELRRMCNASLSPVVALLSNSAGESADSRSLSDHLESVVRLLPPVECLEDDGTRHRMWPLTDQTARTELERRMANSSVHIISGSAAYHAAIATRDLDDSGDPNDPTRTTMVCLIPADDPGIEFLPHVLAKPASSLPGEEAHRRLAAQGLQCQAVGSETTAGEDAVELASLNAQQPCVAVGTHDGAWMIVSPPVAHEPVESEDLVQQISRIIDQATSASEDAVTQNLPLTDADSAGILRQLQTMSTGMLIVEPARSAADLISLAAHSNKLHSQALRLHPCVPTGLVFSSMGHSRFSEPEG